MNVAQSGWALLVLLIQTPTVVSVTELHPWNGDVHLVLGCLMSSRNKTKWEETNPLSGVAEYFLWTDVYQCCFIVQQYCKLQTLKNGGSDSFFLLGCYVLSVIFCEAVAIYGVIVAIILQTKLESVPVSNIYAPESLRAGYAIFASGIIVGFANLVCGYVAIFPCMYLFRINMNSHQWTSPNYFLSFLCGLKFVCRNNWKQLCVIWCSKLITFC